MYIDPLRNVRGIINKTVSDLESAKRTALKPLLLSNQNLTNTLEINKQLKNQLLQMGSVNVVNLKLSELITLTRKPSFNWNSSYISNPYNFQRNLFSKKAIKSFKNSYGFDDDVVSQAQQTIRDFYINPAAISTLVETINTTNPIKNNQYQTNDNKLKKMFLNKNALPYNVYIKKGGHTLFTTDAGNFIVNFINENSLHVERSLLIAVMALLMYLYSFYPYFKD